MSKGRFIAGLGLGLAAGFAAKYLYDNKEEVVNITKEKATEIKNSVNDFVDYASEKVADISEKVEEKATEYVDYAKKQFEDVKESFDDIIEDVVEEAQEPDEVIITE